MGTTIHQPQVLAPAGTGGAPANGGNLLQLAAALAAMSGGLPVGQAVETLPPMQAGHGCQPQGCVPQYAMPAAACLPPGQVSQLLCSPNARLMVEQLNRMLRPEVPGYPDCATFDPYAPTASVLGQTIAEFRATLASAKRYYDAEAPAPVATATVDDQLAGIAASIAALTASVGTVQASVSAIESDVDVVQTSIAATQTSVAAMQTSVTAVQASVTAIEADIDAVQTSVTGIEADIDQLQTDVADIQGRVTVLESA